MPTIKRRETTAWIKAVAATYGKKVGDIAYIFCDDEKMVAYLETNKESNVSLYKHYGFDLKKEELIPKTPVTHYAMVRKPIGENNQ